MVVVCVFSVGSGTEGSEIERLPMPFPIGDGMYISATGYATNDG